MSAEENQREGQGESQEPLSWDTKKMRVGDLKGFPNNPRKLTDKQRKQLEESINKFNLVEIPAVDQDGTIIAGNQRVDILRMLGRNEEEIEVRVPNRPLTEDERKEYNLRSNKNQANWDWDKLAEFYEDDLLLGIGFTATELEEHGIDRTKIDEEDNKEFEIPEMELKSFEHWDYVVFVCDNVHDWLRLLQEFNIDDVDASFSPKHKKVGLGRVIRAEVLLERLGISDSDTEQGKSGDDDQS